MRDGKRKHMDKDSRVIIEEGIRRGDSARKIAREAGVSPSTVTREVKANRTLKEKKRAPGANLSVRCARRKECPRVGTACAGCSSRAVRCRDCRTRSCIDACPDFELLMCPVTERWPYVCPEGCRKRQTCSYPRSRYRAEEAQAAHDARLASSREGIDLTADELERLNAVVAPLVGQGWSFEAICTELGDGLGVCLRSLYNYQADGILDISSVELPRKARLRPRKRKRDQGRPRIDRSGHENTRTSCRCPSPRRGPASCSETRWSGMQSECARHPDACIIVARHFQLYLRKRHADAFSHGRGASTASRGRDGLVRGLRGRIRHPAPRQGHRSSTTSRGHRAQHAWSPEERRCRVFWCDPQESNQKSEAERNHEQLRRIFPKGHVDMDALTDADVALACSHVNSYPLASIGGCPFGELGSLLPEGALGRLGIVRIPAERVVLRPALVPHAYLR
jgi:transposase, IS30 family